jgi:hypothetical protein
MTQPSLPTQNSGLRVFSASLLSALLIVMPFVQMAAAQRQRSGVGGQRSEQTAGRRQDAASNTANAPENIFLNAPIPKPAPEPLAGPVIVATKDDGVLLTNTVNPGDTVTYTVNIQNNGLTSPGDDATSVVFTDTIDAHTTLVANSTVAAVSDKYNTIGNTQMNVPLPGVLANDFDPDNSPASNVGMTVSSYGATTGTEQTSMGTATPTAQGGSVTVNGDGSFTYNPPSGFEGTDTFKYRATDAHGFTAITTVRITIAGMIWYIDNNATSCTTLAAGCGTLSKPFSDLPSFQAVNDGAAGPPQHPKAGDNIFLYESATNYVGPVTLLSSQRFIGQDSTATLLSLTGLTQPSGANTLPMANPTGANVNITSAAGGILLNSGNLLRGFNLTGTGGTALQGTNFGTLSLTEVNVSSNAQAISLTTGTLSGPSLSTASFGTISSGGGTNGILLNAVAGTMTATGGTLTGTATGSTFSVIGGTVNVTYSGSISQAANNAAVSVIGGHGTGTITFQTGTVSASNGTGLQFDNADGTYNFNATTTLNGGDAGVDILNGSGGTFSFSTNTSITNPSGAGFLVNGSNPGVTYSGNITKNNVVNTAGALVDITNQTGGTITFQTGTLSSTSTSATATGIQLTNADGTVNFSGTTTLNGGDAGVDILAGSGGAPGSTGTFTFGTGTSITRVSGNSGTAFNLSSSDANVTYSGGMTLPITTGAMIAIDNHDAGTMTFQNGTLSTVNKGNTGISISNSGGGTIHFNNPTILLDTGSGNAVSLTGANGGGAMNFTPAAGGNGIDITTSSGVGFNATGGGTVVVTGSGNTITSTTGTALNVANTTIGANGLTFQSISANGAPNGIVLNTTGAAGGLTVTGDGTNTTKGGNASGGTIQNINGADGTTNGIAIYLNNTSNVVLRRMTISGTIQNMGIHGLSVGGLTAQYCTIGGTIGTTSGTNDLNLEGPIVLGKTSPSIANAFANGSTSTIDNCLISGGIQHNVEVFQQANTASLTISNSNITSNSVALGSDGILIETHTDNNGGTARAQLTVAVNSCLFDNNKSQAVQANALGDSFLDLTLNLNTIQKTTQGNEGFVLQNAADGDMVLHVTNNTFTGILGTNILVGQVVNNATANSSLTAYVKSNSMTVGAVGGPYPTNRTLIAFFSSTPGQVAPANVLLESNTVNTQSHPVDGLAEVIFVSTPDANTDPSFTATVLNNVVNINDPGGTALRGIAVQSTQDISAGCIDVRGNDVNYTPAAPVGINGIRVRQVAPATLLMERGVAPLASTAAVALATNNPLSTTEVVGTVIVVENNVCQNPPTSFFSVPSAPREHLVTTEKFDGSDPATLIAATTTREVSTSTEASKSAFWIPIATALTNSASEIGIRIAPSALAHSAEVRDQRSEVRDQRSEVRSHHAKATDSEGRRQKAESRKNHAATTRALTAPVVSDVDVNIGTLPAGGSVTITFQVTVNNPPNLTLLTPNPRVENQGTVMADGGINVLTDDPETGTAGDATVTLIDLFDSQTTLGSDNNPSDQGENVTFTADVTIHPSQTPTPPVLLTPTGAVTFKSDGVDIGTCVNVALSELTPGTARAQCTTNALAPPSRNITAEYSGDGNYDTSISNTVAQTVVACSVNPVVTNTADSGAGSLREALAGVCSAPNNNVTFNIPDPEPGLSGGIYTITLLTELVVAKNVNITGPNSVTNTNPIVVSGNNATRVFNINAGKTATINLLTITGGNSAQNGGGILNEGTLTLKNSTVSGNATTQSGAGIHNSSVLNIVNSTISGNASLIDGGGIVQDGVSPTLYMVNSTVSGNTANGFAGGLDLRNGTVTILNSTVTGNHSDNDNDTNGGAGGIRQQSATVIRNTIVAGNYKGSGTTTANDIEGAVSGNNNLIGDAGTAGGLTNGDNGNIVGAVIANVLDTVLANNGGPTKTHRLITGSAALDAGQDASLPTDTFDADGDANTGEALDVDQRGQPRVVDNPNVANANNGLDIGAYEAPAPPSTPDLDAASDTGASNTDNYTADNTPTFTIGGVENGAFVELLADATVVASGTAVGTSIQLTSSVLSDGTYSFTARQTVAGGLSPTSTGLNVTIDTGAPGVPTIDLVEASDSGSSNSDNITNAATRTFDIGNTETGATIELLRDGNPVGGTTTGNGGTVQLSDSTAAVSGTTYAYTARQTDGGGNPATSSAINVLFDNVGPTVSMSSVAPNPTNTSPIPVSVLFNESVNGFDALDIVPGNATVANFAGSGANYTFDLVPSGQGLVTADINSAAAQDTAGNDNSAATQFSRTFDTDAPTADITDVTPDPRNTAVSSITIVFSEAVTGFDLDDLSLTLNGGADLLTGAQTLTTGDNITWTLNNLSGITAAQGAYLLTLTAAGSGITDSAGNALAGDATDTWVMDTTAPTVTINQASGQADPTSSSPINFTVVFSEPVTGFDNTDVTFSGAGATTATVTEIAPNDGTTYNVAISGMNADGTVQASVNVNAAQDGAGNNSAASTSTDNQVQFINAITINIHDAKVAEPAIPNTVDMTFTVSLSSPAPAGGISVNFTTNNGSATAGTCNTPGADYTSTNGTVTFTVGQQVKTINVTVCSDNVSEGDETFTVTLSSPTSPGVLGTNPATGTITAANPAGEVLISEIRTSGPGGAGDDFVELYNNSNSAKDISGYGLFKMGATCTDTPVLIAAIPGAPGSNTTVIPARGHFLFVGSAYSLANYGGTGAAAGNLLLTADIETDRNVGLFSTSNLAGISSVNRLDAVGFGVNTGGACDLLREATPLPAIAGNATIEHSYFRKMCEWIQHSGCTVPGIPKDTNNNADDFWLADTAGSPITGRLGAPGPENLASPIRRDNAGINVFVLDGTVAAAAHPNRSRNSSEGAGFPPTQFGTMTLRYRVTNNTGGPVTRLRYRVVDISTAIQPAGPTADLRALTSSIELSVGPVNDAVTCTAVGAGAPPCTVTVTATTLETPPNQAIGGGYNSTLSSDEVTITPLANGQSILINFKLGVQQTGTFRFYIVVEALP